MINLSIALIVLTILAAIKVTIFIHLTKKK